MHRTLAFATGTATLLLVAILFLSGTVPASPALDAVVPWVGFGGAFLLLILAIRSRRS
jgi:hypothetical protein